MKGSAPRFEAWAEVVSRIESSKPGPANSRRLEVCIPMYAATGTRQRLGGLFSFPDPVNEVSARLVAAGVVVMGLAALAFDLRWLTLVIAYGFWARVLTGPTLSPLGLLVTKVVTPRLPFADRPVAGPPKRFAQGLGVFFSTTADILAFGFDRWGPAQVVLSLLVGAACLESAFGFCLGCKTFGFLMRVGIIPEAVCERCNDVGTLRRP